MIWKEIKGFSRYQVSETGLIRSMNYKRTGHIKELKPALDKGYCKTMILSDDGKYKTVAIHRLIAETFLKKLPGTEVNHKDGNKSNNNISNLEYVTHKENIQHSYNNGLQQPQRGSKNGNSKLTEDRVRHIKEYVKAIKVIKGRYWGRKQVAESFGIKESHLKDILKGRTWSYV